MKITKSQIQRWQANAPVAFLSWLDDIQPRILHRDGRYRIFEPTVEQNGLIRNVLASDNGNFLHSLSLIIAPRRHSKSTLFALMVLWLFTSRRNFTVMLLGNSELHSRRTQFGLLVKIIRATPILNKAITEDDCLKYEIRFRQLGNSIQLAAHNTAASFGDRLNLLWVSDLHACSDLAPFRALQAALLDSEDSLCFIDSNVDYFDGPVHALQKEAEEDATIFCSHLEYANLEDYLKRAPAWIDRQKARRLQRTTLPSDFARDILGKRLDAKNALFPSDIIRLCKSSYKLPVADITELTKGRAYKIGGGLDRSKSLFQGPRGDATVWTVVLKVASPEHGEPEFFILNQRKINPNTSRLVKKAILDDHRRYGLDNVILENYETADIAPWLSDQNIPHELLTATDTNQNASFPEFHRVAKEGRFHFPESLKDLEDEMRTFSYIQRTGGNYSFGHSSSKYHDDHVYSVNWAIFSLRRAVMNLYSLSHVMCNNRTAKRHLCYLMGGKLTPFCARDCYAHQKVKDMFEEYMRFQLDEMTIPEFFDAKVKLTGSRISQAI